MLKIIILIIKKNVMKKLILISVASMMMRANANAQLISKFSNKEEKKES